jgi:hypothetical protein
MAIPVDAGASRQTDTDYVFFVSMGVAIAVMVAIGFTTSFLRTNLASQLQSLWVKAHAAAFTCWILLFLAQTVLVASGRRDIHRRLGVAGVVLACVMIALALASAIGGFWKSPPRPIIDHVMLYVVVHVDMFMFALFVTAGLLLRNRYETHKRLMFLATVALLDAVTERLPGIAHISSQAHYVIVDVFVIAGVAYDLMSLRRVNLAYLWGALVIFMLPPASRLVFQFTVPHLVGIDPS